MPNIKQLKIGNVDYDIKALKAANQGQYNAVVRDIAYGTESPSGGDNGAVYLQYNTSNTNNPYVYAEDTIGDQQNAADLYYSKNEVNNLLTGYHEFKEILLSVNSQYVTSSNLYALQVGDNMVMVTGWITVNASVTGSKTLFYLPTDLVAVINTLVVSWDTTNNTPEMFYIGNNLNYFTSRRALTSGHTYQFSQIIFTRPA